MVSGPAGRGALPAQSPGRAGPVPVGGRSGRGAARVRRRGVARAPAAPRSFGVSPGGGGAGEAPRLLGTSLRVSLGRGGCDGGGGPMAGFPGPGPGVTCGGGESLARRGGRWRPWRPLRTLQPEGFAVETAGLPGPGPPISGLEPGRAELREGERRQPPGTAGRCGADTGKSPAPGSPAGGSRRIWGRGGRGCPAPALGAAGWAGSPEAGCCCGPGARPGGVSAVGPASSWAPGGLAVWEAPVRLWLTGVSPRLWRTLAFSPRPLLASGPAAQLPQPGGCPRNNLVLGGGGGCPSSLGGCQGLRAPGQLPPQQLVRCSSLSASPTPAAPGTGMPAGARPRLLEAESPLRRAKGAAGTPPPGLPPGAPARCSLWTLRDREVVLICHVAPGPGRTGGQEDTGPRSALLPPAHPRGPSPHPRERVRSHGEKAVQLAPPPNPFQRGREKE